MHIEEIPRSVLATAGVDLRELCDRRRISVMIVLPTSQIEAKRRWIKLILDSVLESLGQSEGNR
jgi:hypothetical protein